ncbi:hypothetical protein AWC29_22210 [Mycobacterium triplex]|uniref:TIGR02611 family protein n=1 Tax=Mycobacterium triplex TaxID=47839 RepID=A0A024JZ13_9MYCO|nr:hypothetical protein [Mycobacterium triplex]ORX01903.1 hypothetical protein AWC29_22210 [Mycobacterium triplex]CDO88901.1 hypothetical protein BN973_03271 [Mycobacterium triplex]
MDSADQQPGTRADALARVLAYRTRGRARSMPVRVGLAVLGGVLLVASIPLIVLLPEVGIPALLVAFRLLAVEALWAARAYAWTDWRFSQLRQWFGRQSRAVRGAIVVSLILLAVAIVVVFVYEFI